MTSRVLTMEKGGYLVYKFYDEDRVTDVGTDQFFKEHKIKKLPVVLVFNGGKVVSRHTGIVEVEKIIKGMKKKDEQQVSPYDGWTHE